MHRRLGLVAAATALLLLAAPPAFALTSAQGGPERALGPALTQVAATGAINGHVLDATGAAAGDILVYACAGTCTHVWSSPDGSFNLTNLAAGSYRIGIEDIAGRLPGGYATMTGLTTSAAAAALVAVADAPVTFDVHAPVGLHIGGTITAASGGPLQGVLVEACMVATFLVDRAFDPCGASETAADGTYKLTVLPAVYEVVVFDPTHARAAGYYSVNGFQFPERLATAVPVSTTDVIGIDVALVPGQSVGGKVTDSNGAPVADITVEVCLSTDPNGCGAARTDTDGSYSVEDLPAGTFDVAFIDESASHPTGFYGATGFVGDSGQAQPVILSGSGATGIDVRFPVGYVISGTVTSPLGPVASASIDDCTTALCVPVASTAADGTYRLNVAAGQHSIHVSDFTGSSLSGFYSTAGLANSLHATKLTIGSADVSGINFALRGIGAGAHPGTLHTGSFVASTVVTGGSYATMRFTLGKAFAGTRIKVLRAVKSSTGKWSTFRSVATIVVGADGNAYYSTRVSGSLAFKASASDALVSGVQVLSGPVYARGR